jgi:hypothetical protein
VNWKAGSRTVVRRKQNVRKLDLRTRLLPITFPHGTLNCRWLGNESHGLVLLFGAILTSVTAWNSGTPHTFVAQRTGSKPTASESNQAWEVGIITGTLTISAELCRNMSIKRQATDQTYILCLHASTHAQTAARSLRPCSERACCQSHASRAEVKKA